MQRGPISRANIGESSTFSQLKPEFIHADSLVRHQESIQTTDDVVNDQARSKERFDALLDKMLPGQSHLLAPHSKSTQNTFFTQINSGLGPVPLHRKNYPRPPPSVGGFVKTVQSRMATPIVTTYSIDASKHMNNRGAISDDKMMGIIRSQSAMAMTESYHANQMNEPSQTTSSYFNTKHTHQNDVNNMRNVPSYVKLKQQLVGENFQATEFSDFRSDVHQSNTKSNSRKSEIKKCYLGNKQHAHAAYLQKMTEKQYLNSQRPQKVHKFV